jgi:hypothetical protein
MALHPITKNPLTNADMAEVAAWEAAHTKPFMPSNTVLQPMNKSAAAVEKAKGAARPLEKRPNKPMNPNQVNTTGGTKLSFRKTRKARKARKTRKARKSRK